ncbi:MAG: copper amine oxidase N-terminal domain-containing protein [Peptoniphilus grossensis]|uniref:copper amine oxidase N-terminal domain-containing protein n=1 Tax=Peptoniphilus grossensis TaxID=1465756 RepID=UPI002913FE62|nr:copper amine oxidase N-terminal domain-containing protein [Peptoniphilus grossensis]MDU7151542.1 copper amine oxidase N-terminal domain-containing protein [Peptoniphilus grossensis]
MKKFKKLAIVGIMSMVLSTSVFAAGKLPKDALDKNVNIYINNNLQNIPEDMGRAYLDKNTNRVMVPIRYISENLGAQINFYQRKETNTSGILIGAIDVLVELDINSTKAKLNLGGEDSVVNLDSPAILYDGRTYVPIRFISETLGLNVDWKDDSVYISGKFKTKGKRYNYEEDNNEEEIKKDNNSDKYLDQFNIPREKVQERKESNSIFQ